MRGWFGVVVFGLATESNIDQPDGCGAKAGEVC